MNTGLRKYNVRHFISYFNARVKKEYKIKWNTPAYEIHNEWDSDGEMIEIPAYMSKSGNPIIYC